MRMTFRLSAVLVFWSVLCGACASVPLKDKAVLTLQASETALEASHNAERSFCSPGSDQSKPITHCDSQAAATVGLTDAVHRKLAAAYAKAFDYQLKAEVVLRTWRAGDPPPATVTQYKTALTEILTVVVTVLPQQAETVAKLQAAIDAAARVAAAVGVQ